MKIRWGFFVLLCGLVVLRAAWAQYAVGQRVQVDIEGGGAGTVIEIGHGVPYEGYVKVHFDKRHHYDAKAGEWVEIKSGKIHPLVGGSSAAPAGATGTRPSPAQEKESGGDGAEGGGSASPAPPPQGATPHYPPMSDLSGDSIEAHIKRAIAGRYVRNGGALDAHHTPATVHFWTFAITGSRPYAMPPPGSLGSPDGPGGRMGTKVYLVSTKYTVCLDYPGYAPTGNRGRLWRVEHDAAYKCFIDSSGHWRCNQSRDRTSSRYVEK
jgi:hypothetical protein